MGRRAANRVAKAPRLLVEAGPAGAPPGQDCRTASSRWGPWPAPCATSLRRRPARHAATGRPRESAGCRAARRGAPGGHGTAARHDRTSGPQILQAVCRSGSGWGCVEDGGRGARAMARCVDPPHGQGYTKCHGQGCRSVRGGDCRCEAAAGPQARDAARQGWSSRSRSRVPLGPSDASPATRRRQGGGGIDTR